MVERLLSNLLNGREEVLGQSEVGQLKGRFLDILSEPKL